MLGKRKRWQTASLKTVSGGLSVLFLKTRFKRVPILKHQMARSSKDGFSERAFICSVVGPKCSLMLYIWLCVEVAV